MVQAPLEARLLEQASRATMGNFVVHGGFRRAPKFSTRWT